MKNHKDMHALVIEDDEICRFVMQDHLESLGLKASSAPTANTAKSLLHNHYNLVFVDIGLPDQDGVSLADEIKAKLPKVIIIAISGRAYTEHKSLFDSAQIDYVLRKPIAKDDIRKLLIAAGLLL